MLSQSTESDKGHSWVFLPVAFLVGLENIILKLDKKDKCENYSNAVGSLGTKQISINKVLPTTD